MRCFSFGNWICRAYDEKDPFLSFFKDNQLLDDGN